MLNFVLKKRGFSLIELLVVVAIIGTLSVLGIKSYKSQMNKARMAEAKQSLSFLFTAERSFFNTWDTYHENLVVVGAAPAGQYNYDVGFQVAATDMAKDGSLTRYPQKDILDIAECINFAQICNRPKTEASGCLYKVADKVSGVDAQDSVCRVNSKLLLSTPHTTDESGASKHTVSDAKTEKTTSTAKFKAYATGKLNSNDIWSINEAQKIQHETDGSE